MSVVTLRQVHSDIVHRVDSLAASQEKAAQADALITRERGVLLAVQTADCVPILLADTKNRAVRPSIPVGEARSAAPRKKRWAACKWTTAHRPRT